MKKVLLLVVLSTLMVGCSSSDEVASTEKAEGGTVDTEQVTTNEFTDAQRQEITDYFLSDEEPTVLDATWTTNKTFKIGVKDDGTNRDGLAEYACNMINLDFNGSGQEVTVQVIDYPKLMSTNKWVKLGEVQCYK